MEKNKKKKIIIMSVVIIALVLILILLWWLFFRKIEVTLDYNNGKENETVLVRINKKIDKDKIDEDSLGEKFIGWFKVIEVKDDKEILEKKEFDFDTKIKKEIKLNALYQAETEPASEEKTVTVKFDTKGGSKVNDITLKEGEKLTLPKNPTKKGFDFVNWQDKNKKGVKSGLVVNENMTLYALWKEVAKAEPAPAPTPEPAPVPVESISLSLSRNIGHANGYNTGKASATVQNASGDVTYTSSSTDCLTIDSKTGDFKLKSYPPKNATITNYMKCIVGGSKVKITATLPSGLSDTKDFTIEPLLVIKDGQTEIKKGFSYGNEGYVDLTSNVDVDWNSSFGCGESGTVSGTPVAITKRKYTGSVTCSYPRTLISPSFELNPITPGGQKLNFSYQAIVN